MRPNDYRDQLDALAKAAAEYQEAVRLAGSYPGHEEFVQAEFVEIHGRLDDADVDLADRLVVARAALGVVGEAGAMDAEEANYEHGQRIPVPDQGSGVADSSAEVVVPGPLVGADSREGVRPSYTDVAADTETSL